MQSVSGKHVVLLLGGVLFATEFAWRCYKKYIKADKKSKKSGYNKKPITDVLFFNENAANCRIHANFPNPCMTNCPIAHLNKIVEYISSATRTLDICVYFLTCNCIVKAILDMQRQGVIVRVITDDESSGNDASQIMNMRRAGCMVRSRKMEYLMHHKFAIVDRQLLINGSANWTMQAFFGNFENIIITNHSDIVEPFIKEFEILWLKFSNEYSVSVEV